MVSAMLFQAFLLLGKHWHPSGHSVLRNLKVGVAAYTLRKKEVDLIIFLIKLRLSPLVFYLILVLVILQLSLLPWLKPVERSRVGCQAPSLDLRSRQQPSRWAWPGLETAFGR